MSLSINVLVQGDQDVDGDVGSVGGGGGSGRVCAGGSVGVGAGQPLYLQPREKEPCYLQPRQVTLLSTCGLIRRAFCPTFYMHFICFFDIYICMYLN